jgi:hypothetical protein
MASDVRAFPVQALRRIAVEDASKDLELMPRNFVKLRY